MWLPCRISSTHTVKQGQVHVKGMGTQVILVRVRGHRLILKVHRKEMTIVQI